MGWLRTRRVVEMLTTLGTARSAMSATDTAGTSASGFATVALASVACAPWGALPLLTLPGAWASFRAWAASAV
jgi:hypothetical protein